MIDGDATRVEPSPLDTDEIPIPTLRVRTPRAWSRTWGLGVLATVLCGVQAVSGLVLMFHYRPLGAAAYLDTRDLVEVGAAGFVRALHLWASHALLIAVAMHLVRVVVGGAYRPPRHVNYLLGVVLLVLVVALATSGYLLPLDLRTQGTLAALHGAAPADADAHLSAAFALHCGVLPALVLAGVVYHLRRAVRDGRRPEDEP